MLQELGALTEQLKDPWGQGSFYSGDPNVMSDNMAGVIT
jgi:hypothetical protein